MLGLDVCQSKDGLSYKSLFCTIVKCQKCQKILELVNGAGVWQVRPSEQLQEEGGERERLHRFWPPEEVEQQLQNEFLLI